VHIAPWFEVACDLIGPWKINIQGNSFSFQALTIIDQVTNYCEIIQIPDKTSTSVARAFENNWLASYPRPMKVIHDQGLEFLGRPFEQMLTNAGVRPHATGARNPRANAIVERLHQTIGNSLRTRLREHPPTNLKTARQYIDDCLATAAYALRASVHRILQCSPGTLAFHRDMLLDVPVLINLETIRQQREALRDTVLQRENKKRFLMTM
jgi:transposase InsO family protein